MLDLWLRPLKDRALEPFARRLGGRIHPHVISVVGVLTGLTAAFLAAQTEYRAALLCWIANRALDGLDGVVSRLDGRQSDFGGYLDIVFDYIVYAAIPIGLVAGTPSPEAYGAGLILLASFLINAASWMYLAAILERRNLGASATGERTTITMPRGLIAGSETIVFYALFLVFPQRFPLLFDVMAGLVFLTIIQRMKSAASTLDN